MATLHDETSTPTFALRWRWAVEEVGDRPFLTFEASDGTITDLTYSEMDDLVLAVAAGLQARGVGAGEAVHLVQSNSVGFVAVWLACAALGAWIVPSDPRAARSELADHIARTRPVVGVCSPTRIDDYRGAVAQCGHAVDIVEVDEVDVDLERLKHTTRSGGPPAAGISARDRLAVMFTSGTTSAPKGVVVTQANYAFAGDVMAALAGLTRFDRQLVVLPLFHANAQYYSFAAAISAGASVALMHAFSASGFVEQARRHAATHASLFAAPMRMILARTPEGTAPLALRHAWFAQNLSREQYRDISHLLGCRPRQIYGMTETAPAVLANPPIGSIATAMGTSSLGCQVRVVDSERRPVGPNDTGSIQVGGYPGTTLFDGYLDDPATTETSIVERRADGFVWFDTGDRATVGEHGVYYFAGRRTDILKVAGENVSTVEVEHAIAEHPAVREVAVVGTADAVLDEVPEAYVVLEGAGAVPHDIEQQLTTWAARHLAPSKRPRAYHVVRELPRTSVGKIRKFLLHDDAGQPRHQASEGTEQ